MDFVYELLRAGTTQSDSDTGSEVARKFNENFEKVSEKFTELDQSLSESIRNILVGGKSQTVSEGQVEIPIGDSTQAGVVKSSDEKNKININQDGTMEVSSLGVDKLVQDDGDYVILDGNCE